MERGTKRKQATLLFIIAMLVTFCLGVGLSYAYFSDSKSASNTLSFGKLKIATNSSSGVNLTLKDNASDASGRLMPDDKITIIGSIGLEDNSVSAYIRMKMDIYEKGTTNTVETTFKTILMEEMAKIKDGDMQWFIVGKYLYLGNNITASESFDYNSDIILTEAMMVKELQGKDIDIVLTYQAIQSFGMGLTLEDYTVDNATKISKLEAWAIAFGVGIDIYDSDSNYFKSYVRGNLSGNEDMGTTASFDSYVNDLFYNDAFQMAKSPFNYFNEDSVGDYVAFGYYPQTIKVSDVTVGTISTTFAGFTCYVGSDNYLYVKKTAKVFVDRDQPEFDYCTKYSGNYNGSSNVIKDSGECYFKLEPVIYKILNPEETTGNWLLQSVVQLYAGIYYNGEAYEIGAIRKSLSTFASQSFTASQLGKISKGSIADGASVEDENGDLVFLLSKADLTNVNYGFNKDFIEVSDKNRTRWVTDFAGATCGYGGVYWSRTIDTNYAVLFGSLVGSGYVFKEGGDDPSSPDYSGSMSIEYLKRISEALGVVPALFLKISN